MKLYVCVSELDAQSINWACLLTSSALALLQAAPRHRLAQFVKCR